MYKVSEIFRNIYRNIILKLHRNLIKVTNFPKTETGNRRTYIEKTKQYLHKRCFNQLKSINQPLWRKISTQIQTG